MEKDKFLRKTEGKLPEAEIVFLDEIFKSNEPTLNILLPLINEKIFYNDGKPVPVPLVTLFAASNELPEDESLGALYDRLLFRHWVDYVSDQGNRYKMYESYVDKRNGVNIKPFTTISMEELFALQNAAKEVTFSPGVSETSQTLFRHFQSMALSFLTEDRTSVLKSCRVMLYLLAELLPLQRT